MGVTKPLTKLGNHTEMRSSRPDAGGGVAAGKSSHPNQQALQVGMMLVFCRLRPLSLPLLLEADPDDPPQSAGGRSMLDQF